MRAGSSPLISYCVLYLTSIIYLTSCEAYDLGDRDPISYQIDQANPTWAGGVGQLVAAKCANCHSSQRSKFVPSDTPTGYDDIAHESFFSTTNTSRIQTVYSRVFESPTRPMPPNFATPLTESEKSALRTFLNARITTLSSLCGTSGSSSLNFTTASTYLTNACAACHNSAAPTRTQYSTLEQVKSNRLAAATRLKETSASRVMPQSNLNYKNTTEGVALINWLCFGSDLN